MASHNLSGHNRLKTILPEDQSIFIQKAINPFKPTRRGWIDGRGQFVCVLVSLLIVSACSTKPRVLKQTDIKVQESQQIYVVRQGLHTGFVLPAGTVKDHLPDVYESFAGSPYIEFGWGDMDYYQSETVTSGMTTKAVFWPTRSVIRTVAIGARPEIHFPENEMELLCLDQDQFSLLIAFILQSFSRDSDGRIINTIQSADGNSRFYKAEGVYYLWNTCNNWTAKGLKSTGWKIAPTFKITPGSVMANLDKNNTAPGHELCEAGRTSPERLSAD
jgi:uncharacterized protein (TIGR02117 family)